MRAKRDPVKRAIANKKWREANKERRAAYGRQYYLSHREQAKENTLAVRKEVLQAYGGAFCKCCGETTVEFLAIDHIAGGGNKHRKSLGLGGSSFVYYLRSQGYPPGYQILCHNCNFAKHAFKECPHASVLRSHDQRGTTEERLVTS